MSALARRAADVDVMARFRRWVEERLPWYDPAAEREHRAYSEDLTLRGKAVGRSAEQVREEYASAARTRLRR